MALVLGTNCGFVTSAPSADPTATSTFNLITGNAPAIKDTSPSGNNIITEIGIWINGSINDVGVEIGLYSEDTGPDTRLQIKTGLTLGTSPGWIVYSGLNWSLTASTSHWIAVQVDGSSSATTDRETSGGPGYASDGGAASLTDPYGGAVDDVDGIIGIYALTEEAAVVAGQDGPYVY